MEHSEKQHRPTENQTTSQPLKIDSPESEHEKQAESVAERVSRNGQIMGSERNKNGQIMSNSNNSTIAPPGVKEQINSSKGSGDKLPDSIKRMVKGKSGELDEVRIHTDSKAAELSESVNAKAFTHGKDIYFGQGKFDDYTSGGKELIAHEIQHTLQNAGTEAHIIQRSVKVPTAWGDFEEGWQTQGKSIDYGKKNPVYGFGGVLTYTPKDPTDSTKIGLVQISRGFEEKVTKKGKKYEILYDEETRESHAIKKEDSTLSNVLNENEEGFHVDREGAAVNPLYAVTSAVEGETLSQGKTDTPIKEKKDIGGTYYEGAGQHGWHYTENGVSMHQNAEIFDVPYFSVTRGNTGGIVLETAAVALEGNQKGRYYGSVTWGWSVDASEKLTANHIKLASMGAVTPTFMKAAHMWNAGVTSKGKATTDLPTQDFYSLKANGEFYPGEEFSTANKAPIETPSRFERVVTDKKASDPDMIYIRVVDGLLSGGTGWISQSAIELEDNVPKSLKGKN